MKIYAFLIGLLFISQIAVAEQHVRKVPFLPYAGAMNRYQVVTSAGGQRIITNNTPFTKQPIRKSYESIFFEEDSAKIRGDQFQKLKRLANRLKSEGSYFYSIVGYTTPEIDTLLAQDRIKTIKSAMEDYGIKGEPTTSVEYKKNPVLNPNRVEVHMQPLGLGTTIRD